MKTLTYIGELADGYVEEPGSGHTFPFRNGEPVLLPDDLAASLLQTQSQNWQGETAPKKQKKSED